MALFGHPSIRPSFQRQEAHNRPLRDGVSLHFGDMSDLGRLLQIFSEIRIIDAIYHLAAQSPPEIFAMTNSVFGDDDYQPQTVDSWDENWQCATTFYVKYLRRGYAIDLLLTHSISSYTAILLAYAQSSTHVLFH